MPDALDLTRRAVAPLTRTRAFRRYAPRVLPSMETLVTRLSRGRLQLAGLLVPALELHTIGARTGQPRSSRLMYTPDGPGRAIVAGSNFARGGHPAWTANLRAHPDAEITVYGRTIAVHATEIGDEERDAVWARIEAQWPGYRGYERESGRTVRLFRLETIRMMAPSQAFGEEKAMPRVRVRTAKEAGVEIRGNVFVVTGGGNGIGRAVVLALLAEGGRVAAVDLRAESLARTAELADPAVVGDRLTTHALDVSDAAAVAALPALVTAAHGRVDGVINIAGIIQRFVPVTELARAEIEKVMAVNFWGVVNMSLAFLPSLRERPASCLINISSMGALSPVPGQSVYGASKAAVKLFTEGLYLELRRQTSVAVSVVFPGGVGTEIAQNSGSAMPDMDAKAAKWADRLTTPGKAAEIILKTVRSGAPRVRIGTDARWVDRFTRVAPRRAPEGVAALMAKMIK